MASSSSSSSQPVKVTAFPLVRRHLAISAVCALIILASSRRSFIAPGSPIHEYILTPLATAVSSLTSSAPSPSASASASASSLATVERIAATVQNLAFGIFVGVHALEVPLFAVTKLQKHGVPFASALWWKWSVATFFGGKATWDLFAATVKREAGKAR